MPKLKPATLRAKIEALEAELSELQHQRQQLIGSASDPPLIGQYLATKKSGGTAFSGKSENQAAHNYYALVDAAGAFIRYVGKHEVAAYRDLIHLGKQVAKLNRAIACCNKRLNEYKSKLALAEQIQSPTVAIYSSLPESPDNVSDKSKTETPENTLYTVESKRWIVSEAA